MSENPFACSDDVYARSIELLAEIPDEVHFVSLLSRKHRARQPADYQNREQQLPKVQSWLDFVSQQDHRTKIVISKLLGCVIRVEAYYTTGELSEDHLRKFHVRGLFQDTRLGQLEHILRDVRRLQSGRIEE